MNKNLDHYPMSGTTQDAIYSLRTLDAIADECERVNEREPQELVECIVSMLRDAGYRNVPKVDDASLGEAMARSVMDRIGWRPQPIDTSGLDASRAKLGAIIEVNAQRRQDGEETAARR